MRAKIIVILSVHLLCCFFSPVGVFAEEKDNTAFSGEVDLIFRSRDGEEESWKFSEYRTIPETLSGNISLSSDGAGNTYIDLSADNVLDKNRRIDVKAGVYGRYKIGLVYDELPHTFSLGSKTLYSGIGTGSLTIDDSIQQSLQNTGTDNVGDLDGNGTANQANDRNIALAERINAYIATADTTDLELVRRTGKFDFEVLTFDPLRLKVELSKEHRDGTRQIGASFGFTNFMEIPEPIDFETTDMKLSAEYARDAFYLTAAYFLSVFENNNDNLEWDNPLRVTDSNTLVSGSFGSTYNAGSSTGRMGLAPDNLYSGYSFSGTLKNLPLRTRISGTATWSKMEQNEDLEPYTSNTAITYVDPVSLETVNASEVETGDIDAEIDNTLYNLTLTSHPLDRIHIRAGYRHYESDNKTEEISFPGYVRLDNGWRPINTTDYVLHGNQPIDSEKTTVNIGAGFDLLHATMMNFDYTRDSIGRSDNRETTDSDEDIYKLSIDTRDLSWMGVELSYERSKRDGNYDYRGLFKEITTVENAEGDLVTPKLPSLRKFDEADRERDRWQVIASIFPTDRLSFTASAVYGMDDFNDSSFGLLDDRHMLYSLDADYEIWEKLSIYLYFSSEEYQTTQKGRQWVPCNPATDTVTTPGCTGPNEGTGPYFMNPDDESPSNWDAENTDRVDTYGGGMKLRLIPDKLNLEANYLYARSDGKVKLSSPVGENSNVDANPYPPADFSEVDDTIRQTADARLIYTLAKGILFTLGYMFESLDVEDYSLDGFSNVPTASGLTTAPDGTYRGGTLMGTLLEDYTANIIYSKLTFKF